MIAVFLVPISTRGFAVGYSCVLDASVLAWLTAAGSGVLGAYVYT